MLRRCARLAALLLQLLVIVADAAASRPVATATPGDAPGSAGAPDGVPPCLEDVLPCTAYLKTSKHPSATCCTALHNAAAAEMPCLCRLLADPVLLTTFNVTRDQMFKLPARCGLPAGCRAGASQDHDPVVEEPPPPEPYHYHHHDASSRSSEFWSDWAVVASLVVPMAAVF